MPGKASTRATRQVQQSMGHPQAASLSAPSTPARRTQAPSPNKAPPKQSPPSYPTRPPPHPEDMAPASYQKANPAPPNRLPLPPPRRAAEGMRCCGSETGAASTQRLHESVPKRNVRQPTHCTRTTCHHSRPEGQPGACGAAGALWDDKRTETITAPQPQRKGRRPQEKHPRPTWTAPKPAQCPHRRPQPPCKPRTRESDVRAARASQR